MASLTEEEVINLVYFGSDVYLNVRYLEQWMEGHRIRFEFEYKSSRRRRTEDLSISQLNSRQFAYLLKQRFDIFGLIKSGLALDATKINKKKKK